MPQETSNVMSTYEIIATVIAVIALIQPWAIKLWNTLFKKLKITFIPSGKFKLFYNRSGAYVQIGGVIEAKISLLSFVISPLKLHGFPIMQS